MDIKPIKTDGDYEAALGEIDALMEAEPGTDAGDRLDVLATLVEAYERRHHTIEAPDPIEAIRHALDAYGIAESDLQDIIKARRERVWEIMNRRRRLTMPMIRRLNARLKIPADVLIQRYEVATTARCPATSTMGSDEHPV